MLPNFIGFGNGITRGFGSIFSLNHPNNLEFQNSSTGALTTASTVSHTNATTLSVGANLTSGTYSVRVEKKPGFRSERNSSKYSIEKYVESYKGRRFY